MGKYSRSKYGDETTWMMEYILESNSAMDAIASHIRSAVDPRIGIYFYDFPNAYAIRGWVHDFDAGGVQSITAALSAQAKTPYKNFYIPVGANHDFLTASSNVNQGAMIELMLSFFSNHQPIVYHGGEVPGNGVKGLTKEFRPHVSRHRTRRYLI